MPVDVKKGHGETEKEEEKEGSLGEGSEGAEGAEEEEKEELDEEALSITVKKLRHENKKKRLKIKQLNDRLSGIDVEKAGEEKAGDEKNSGQKGEDKHAYKKDVLGIVDKRYIRAELKAALLKAGIKDIDAIKMFDTSGLEIDESGDIVGLEELVADMKEAKDYLFDADIANTTTNKKTPNETKASSKSALEMSVEEFNAGARKLGMRPDQL